MTNSKIPMNTTLLIPAMKWTWEPVMDKSSPPIVMKIVINVIVIIKNIAKGTANRDTRMKKRNLANIRKQPLSDGSASSCVQRS